LSVLINNEKLFLINVYLSSLPRDSLELYERTGVEQRIHIPEIKTSSTHLYLGWPSSVLCKNLMAHSTTKHKWKD